MRVLVLNGSPKGKLSVTLQSVLFLERVFKEDQFEYINVGSQIKKWEKDLSPIMDSIKNADLILFSYPIYTFLAPFQLHKFIELLKKYVKENNVDLSQKFATQITTSKHFYDHTAHQFIEDNSHDLGLQLLKGFSADMTDLLNPKGQKELQTFWKLVKFQMEHAITIPKKRDQKGDFIPQTLVIHEIHENVPTQKWSHKEVVIVTDMDPQDTPLQNMIHFFQDHFPFKTKVINLRDFPFISGCLGCFKCASSGNCVIPDNFDSFLRNDIQKSDAIIYAFSVKDHSMGSLFKMYDDRQFCNGHRTVSIGKPIGYIVNGPFAHEYNLQTIIESRAQVGHQYLAGVASNDNPQQGVESTKMSIFNLSKQLEYSLANPIMLPQNFYGIGGLKIFRDLIFETQGLMKEDYKFYKKHNFFDFPHKNWKGILIMKFFGFMMSNNTLQKKYAHKLNHYILKPYQDVVNKSK